MTDDLVTLRWRLPAEGGYGPPVDVQVPRGDAAYLEDLRDQVEALPEGPERSDRINEFRVHMDLRALLPGGAFVESIPEPKTESVPLYLLAQETKPEPKTCDRPSCMRDLGHEGDCSIWGEPPPDNGQTEMFDIAS